MLEFPRWKIWLVSLVVVVGMFLSIPSLIAGTTPYKSWPAWRPHSRLNLGLALAGELQTTRMARGRILLTVSALGSLVFLSAVAGATVLGGMRDGAMEVVLSFGAAALLYLVTNELLREAHEEHGSVGGTAMFFVGFLAFLVIGMTLG